MRTALPRICVLAAVVVLAVAPMASAWNDRGHMLAAMIAYNELRPEVRERVNAILKDHPQRDMLAAMGPDSGPELDMWIFARAATWPDMIRGKDNPLNAAEHKSQWHYVNFPISFDGTKGKPVDETWDGKNDPANILQALDKVRIEIVAKDTSPDRRAIDLCWIGHLVGDIHQPLHTTNLYSKQFPTGDKGGNSFAVKRGDTPTNLHSYWDNLMGAGIRWDTLQKQYDSLKADPALARKVLLPPTASLKPVDWARDGVKMAQQTVYRNGALKGVAHTAGNDYPKDTPVLPSDYEVGVKKVAAKQVVLAGYRLADVLNAAFAGSKPAVVPAPAAK